MASSDSIILKDLIGDVVDSMRETNTVTDSVETSGTYVITSDNELADNDSIQINDVKYTVSNVSSTGFTITGDEGLDFIGATWQALAPYFMHDVPMNIVKRLNSMNKGASENRKYPAFILFMPFEEDANDDMSGQYGTANPTIAIVNHTKKELYAEDRYNYNYYDVLFPLYYDFLRKFQKSGYFQTMNKGNNVFKHKREISPYYGEETIKGNVANKLTDPLDALVLSNTSLIMKDNRCNFLNKK